MMKKCPECGRKIDYYAETCPYCMAVIVDDGEYAGYDEDAFIEQMDYEHELY